jgi:hypothetical protein
MVPVACWLQDIDQAHLLRHLVAGSELAELAKLDKLAENIDFASKEAVC